MSAPPDAGPDFLCVGMAKSATAWLFDQLRYHPDFWLPSIKEIRYLQASVPKMRNAKDRLEQYADRRRLRHADKADVEFTREAAALAAQPMDIEKYAALFRFKGERLSGDITPGYCRLPTERISQIAERFPHARILLLVREPVARVWSNISLLNREKLFDVSLLSDPPRFRAWFEKHPLKRQSAASELPARWQALAPNLPFRYFLFDDILGRPAEVRRDILEFLGADPKGKSGKLPPGYNRKEKQAKLTLTEPIRAVLIEQLADEIRASAHVFGGAAKEWPARNGL
jgi:hypothetical protein